MSFLIKIIVFTLLAQQAIAQVDTLSQDYCQPRIKGVPSGKGFSLDYESQPNYSMTTKDKTGLFGDSKINIRTNSRIKVKAKIPILNKPHLSIIAGMRYQKEEYHFENNSNNNPFFNTLEDKGLKTIGSDFLIMKPTKSKNYWFLRVKADFNGDYTNNFLRSEFLKFSVSPAWGRKVTEDFTFALGLSYNYRFGSPMVIPIFSFNKNFNEKWDIESILPINVKIRFKPNENLNWINAVELEGASYKLNSLKSEALNFKNTHLHRSDVRFTTRVEKRLSGWFWMAAAAGISENIIYNVTNSNQSKKKILLKNDLKTGFLFNVSIFISPNLK